MKLNLLVIRTTDPCYLKKQYELIGLEFEYHQHGNGPWHYTSQLDALTLEIYPLATSQDTPDPFLRLGFVVDDIDEVIVKIKDSGWSLVSMKKQTAWGLIALLEDPDGRKIELKQSDGATLNQITH